MKSKTNYLEVLMKFTLKTERLFVLGEPIEVEKILPQLSPRSVRLVGVGRLSGFKLTTLVESFFMPLPGIEAEPTKFVPTGDFPARHMVATCHQKYVL
jgi:hypothetical protein